MAEIVNLRQARKRKARAEKDADAQTNRVAFGTPKALRKLEDARNGLVERRHEGRRLGEPEGE